MKKYKLTWKDLSLSDFKVYFFSLFKRRSKSSNSNVEPSFWPFPDDENMESFSDTNFLPAFDFASISFLRSFSSGRSRRNRDCKRKVFRRSICLFFIPILKFRKNGMAKNSAAYTCNAGRKPPTDWTNSALR